MSNEADDTLDLLIRIKSDTAGAEEGKKALNEVTGATSKGAAATQEASKATEKHTVGLHAMHQIFHSLNEIVPGLGAVMQFAFSPVGAAISVAVLALLPPHSDHWERLRRCCMGTPPAAPASAL